METCGVEPWYRLRAGAKRGRFFQGRATGLVDRIAPSDLTELFLGNLKPTAPVRIDAFLGTRPGDFVWCDPVPVTCVSKRVVDCFTEHGITGWAVYPVVLADRKGLIVPDYWGLSIIGRIGYLVGSKSKLETREPVVPGGPTWRVYVGMRLDCTDWDGSDICVSRGRHAMWCREKVITAINDCGLTNAEYMRVEQIEWYEALFANEDEPSVKWEA